MKKECKIIQNFLLPNYIENLTDEEINEYIENHIKDCTECSETLSSMKRDFNTSNSKVDYREVEHMKKYNNKLKLLKFIVSSILLILILIFTIVTARKMIIISDLYNKAKKYENLENYHITEYSYKNGSFWKNETFVKDDKVKIIIVSIKDEEEIKTIDIGKKNTKDNFYTVNTYMQTKGRKIAMHNVPHGRINSTENLFYTKNLWELFVCSIKSNIKEKTINNNKCYYIDNFTVKNLDKTLNDMYIDKDTGLNIYSNESDEYILETIYEFDTVKEEDFVEPDISEYEIMTVEEYVETGI